MARTGHAVIVADGDVDTAWVAALGADAGMDQRPLLIAADGGAAKVLAAGLQPDIVVGDLDSLAPRDRARLEGLGVEVRVADPDKDESDMELCLLAALDAGASRLSITGALGGTRPEHTVANLLLLADERLDGVDAEIVHGGSRMRRVGSVDGPGQRDIEGQAGDFVSLFPWGGDVEGVSTEGLRFPLHDEPLRVGPSRGLSNELLVSSARVSCRRGRLLLVHTARTGH